MLENKTKSPALQNYSAIFTVDGEVKSCTVTNVSMSTRNTIAYQIGRSLWQYASSIKLESFINLTPITHV